MNWIEYQKLLQNTAIFLFPSKCLLNNGIYNSELGTQAHKQAHPVHKHFLLLKFPLHNLAKYICPEIVSQQSCDPVQWFPGMPI